MKTLLHELNVAFGVHHLERVFVSEKDQQPTRYSMFCFPLVVTPVRPCAGIGFQGIGDHCCLVGLTLTSSPGPGGFSRKLQTLLRLLRGHSLDTRPVSAQNLGEGMSEQVLGTGPVFGLHKNAAYEVPRLVGGVRGQQWVGGLRGDLEYGRHGLVFSPRRLFCQHLHHRTTEAPVRQMHHFNLQRGHEKQAETNISC